MARRPYDIRHAGVSWCLNARTPAPLVAEWAGHTVEVLFRIYAHCIDGRAAEISATDAIVAAYASACPDPVVLTSDPHDLIALSEHTARPIAVARS
jgi:hypothetical protein